MTRNWELFGRIQNLFEQHYYTYGTFFDVRSAPSLHLSDPRTVSPAQALQPMPAYGSSGKRLADGCRFFTSAGAIAPHFA